MANEEKKEFLKREEIRTMNKDISLAREGETRQGRERIAGLKIKEEVEKKREKPSFVAPPKEPEQKFGRERIAETTAREAPEEKEEKELKKEKEVEKKEEEEIKKPSVAPASAKAASFAEVASATKAELADKKATEGKEEKALTWEEERKRLAEDAERKWEIEQERIKKEKEESIFAKKGEKEKLRAELADIEKSLARLPLQRKPLQDRKGKLLEAKEQLEERLAPILKEESKIEEKKKEIEQREEKAPSAEKRREIEQERWGAEKERKEIEARKWKIEEEIEEIEKEIREIASKFQEIFKEEESLNRRKEEIAAREKEIGLEDEKEELEKEITEFIGERQPLDRKFAELSEKKRAVDENFNKILKEEREIEEEIKIIEGKEKSAPSLKEQREIEKKRWEIEKDRVEVEKERWNLENKKKEINIQITEVNLNRQRLLSKENRLKVKTKEIEKALQKRAEKEKPPQLKKEEKEEKEEEPKAKREMPEGELIKRARERLERLKKGEGKKPDVERMIEQRNSAEGLHRPYRPEPTEEPRRDFANERLDKARLAFGERKKRIEQTGEKFSERVFGKEKKEFFPEKPSQAPFSLGKGPVPGASLHSLPQRPTPLKKIAVRAVVVLILVLFLAFILFIWPGFLKKGTPIQQEQVTPPEAPLPEVLPEIPPVLETPSSLIEVAGTDILEISETLDISSLFNSVLQTEFQEEEFTRILFKNPNENRFIELSEFLDAFQTQVPEGFYQKLGEFTLFIYPQEEGKRFGFVAEIKNKEGLAELLTSWEPTLEKDFENIFIVMGKEEQALSPSFKSAEYQGTTLRYQTFSRQDFGLVYSIFNDYLIFTTSFGNMEKILDKLKAQISPLSFSPADGAEFFSTD